MIFSRNFRSFVCFSLLMLTGTGLAAPVHAASTAENALDFQGARIRLARLPPAMGEHGMVVSAQKLASDAGVRVLKEGGNAVDAAVAVGYALAVVYPAAGNIGGGGFMTLRTPDGKSVFIDFREHAPLAAKEDMYRDKDGHVIPGLSTKGWKSVAVPGTVAGLELALKTWGSMTRQQVMAPAIELAKNGYILQENDVHLLATSTNIFRDDLYASTIFLKSDGSTYKEGERLIQSDLATTLQKIADQGPEVFYHGDIAQETVRVSQGGGGLLTLKDLASYKPRVLSPVTCSYRGYQIDTAPPPSGGGVALCEMLNILSGYDLKKEGLYSVSSVHQEVEAMRHTYSDRRDLGDPDFVKNPVEKLIDPSYANAIRAAIPENRAVPSASLAVGQAEPEKPETTHFSVMDKSGYAVAVTYTLNGWFGAKVMAGKAGYFLNDEMDDFSSAPGVPNMFGLVGSKLTPLRPARPLFLPCLPLFFPGMDRRLW